MTRSGSLPLQSIATKRLLPAVLLTVLTACGVEEGRDPDAGAGAALSTQSAALRPAPAALPEANGPCPDFSNGTLTFHPKGIAPRNVRIFMSPSAKTQNGPLIFYWHGSADDTGQVMAAIGPAQLDAIKDQGGIVAAPEVDPDAGILSWFYVTSDSRDDDLRVADEVLACARKKVGVDVSRIHSVGYGTGALQTTQMSYRRSGYIASVATLSGGKRGPISTQDPSNKFAALIIHGGEPDVVIIDYQATSEDYANDLWSKNQYAMMCNNHDNGHELPKDTQAKVWRFFQDNTYGAQPYYNGVPAIFSDICNGPKKTNPQEPVQPGGD